MRKPLQKFPIDAVVQGRLDALERLIDSEYEKSPSVFEARTGIKMTQVNQWFTGYRALRDKALRRLEDATKKPQGFFDQAPKSTDVPWPFQTIAIERFQALTERQQGWVEAKLDGLIERCEGETSESDEAVLQRRTVHKDTKLPDEGKDVS